ncbi:hypothetical protein [Rhodococcoides fascians]|uniref:hypothetical protein n=1 Tax=Rhodococcoides fascians TaxID=1828 RepID=UPI0012D2A8CF|nr:hypothetical protein [Rhodococcus fascians]
MTAPMSAAVIAATGIGRWPHRSMGTATGPGRSSQPLISGKVSPCRCSAINVVDGVDVGAVERGNRSVRQSGSGEEQEDGVASTE